MIRTTLGCLTALVLGLLLSGCTSREDRLRQATEDDLEGVTTSAAVVGSWCYVDQESESVVTLVLAADRTAYLHLSSLRNDEQILTLDGRWQQSGNQVQLDFDGHDFSVAASNATSIQVEGLSALAIPIENAPVLHKQHP